MSTPERLTAAAVDLSPRIQRTSTVGASPSDATETIVATLTTVGAMQTHGGVLLFAHGAFTIGTNGVSYNLKIRQTNASGTTIVATGVIALAAAALGSTTLVGFDASPTIPGQVYVLTATIASATAASTFSAVTLAAIIL